MKKMDELMSELGFNKNAPDSVKEAFIKHLIKASTGTSVMTPSEKKVVEAHPEKILSMKIPQQLSFDFAEENTPIKKDKKTGS